MSKRAFHSLGWLATAWVCWGMFMGSGRAADDVKAPGVSIPHGRPHPWLACTPEELARLRAAYGGIGPDHDVVANVVTQADAAMAQPVKYPPRGGQHNQWYQCDRCQIALATVDDTHHQCPVCMKIYSGPPYDDVLFGHQHNANLNRMKATAWAYAITGNRKYADFAAGILRGYADRYRRYPYHGNSRWNVFWILISGGRLYEQKLNEAWAMTTLIAPAYDLIHDSGALTPEDHDRIRAGLIRPMLVNIRRYQAGINNWQSWHNAAMFWGGVMLNDESFVRAALSDPENGFFFQLEASVSPEGMWYENSWGYHFYALQPLVAVAEGCRRLGVNVWNHPRLHAMFTLPVSYTMADGTLPRLGDDTGTSVSQHAGLMECAYQAYQDPLVLALLPSQATWESILFARDRSRNVELPKLASALFPQAGHAILRSGGEAGLTAALTFGPYGGYHGHLDKLSFVLYAYQQELVVDPGRARSQAYRLPIHRHWYKATLGHAAVVVDQQSQEPAGGKVELFAANSLVTAALATCATAYRGVCHQRLLVMFPEYLLVVDELRARAPRRFDWIIHLRGAAGHSAIPGNPVDFQNASGGYGYIQRATSFRTFDPINVWFEDRRVITFLKAAADGDTEVTLADGPGASVEERIPLVILSRRGRTALFVVAIEPVLQGQEAGVIRVTGERLANGDSRVILRRRGATDTVMLTAGRRLTVMRGEEVILKGQP